MPDRRLTKSDKDMMADRVVDLHRKRRDDPKRILLEKQWREIDRQLAMNPSADVMIKREGSQEEADSWMAETELPNQAETLEISTADARRLMMPKNVDWFVSHGLMTDELMAKLESANLIAGDRNELPSRVDQDNIDKLVTGTLQHFHKQYDFKGNVDLINAESFKYSMGIGRARWVKKRVFLHTNQGVKKSVKTIPMLVPRTVRRTYLDDSGHALSNEGQIVAPGHIYAYKIMAKDLMMASKMGSTDVNSIEGGWIRNALKGWDEDKDIEVIEWEGDMVCPRKAGKSIYLPNAIITIAVGSKANKSERTVVRIRKNDLPYSSYILFPYHSEHIECPYATSPLMKGRPIQAAATDAMNRMMSTAALHTSPPLSRDRDSQEQDPMVYPGAIWGDDVEQHMIGDINAMVALFSTLDNKYQDVTGTNAPRLGAQTLSHTTAFAKEAELSRAQIRVNDYADSSEEGPLDRWLNIEFDMLRSKRWKDTFFLRSYNGFVNMENSLLPDQATFEVFGSGAPADEQFKLQKRAAALTQAVQLDQLAIGLGADPTLDVPAAIRQVLQEGGWTDVDAIIRQETVAGGAAPPVGAPGEAGVAGDLAQNPGLATAALQGISFPR